MTELEAMLYNEVEKLPTDFIEEIVNQESECRYIQFPMIIEGVIDKITKDTETDTYTLEYRYTKNSKDVEIRELDVTKIFIK